MTQHKLWSVEEVAKQLDCSIATADKRLRRWSVAPIAREPGRAGRNLYDPAAVLAARDSAPGQGARTDLRRAETTGEKR
jgi:hypothetical protein